MGIGVNCAAVPNGLSHRTTALSEIGARRPAPQDVFQHLSGELLCGLERFAGGGAFETIRAEWLSFAAGLGAPIRVETRAGSTAGTFRTIDASGRLILDCQETTKVIEAGDVWLDEPLSGTAE
jgi:BirA family biotin operon repressor/biotin-[acetyl-CoA-carboxylase] ligase